MMTKNQFLAVVKAECPTRAQFVSRYKSDHVFRGNANALGVSVIGENVLLPNGKVANAHVK